MINIENIENMEVKNDFKRKLENSVRVNLKPGDLFIAEEPMVIKTLLGSCVSVVMHNSRTKVSTISHAQLPSDRSKAECPANCPVQCFRDSPSENMFKYVTHSSKYMLKRLETMGIKRNEIEVKLFGGANVLNVGREKKTVGTENIEKAHEILKSLNLRVKGEDTGGKQGRTIYLVSKTGDVYVRKHVKSSSKKEIKVKGS